MLKAKKKNPTITTNNNLLLRIYCENIMNIIFLLTYRGFWNIINALLECIKNMLGS